jgi:hypothetical protein
VLGRVGQAVDIERLDQDSRACRARSWRRIVRGKESRRDSMETRLVWEPDGCKNAR